MVKIMHFQYLKEVCTNALMRVVVGVELLKTVYEHVYSEKGGGGGVGVEGRRQSTCKILKVHI